PTRPTLFPYTPLFRSEDRQLGEYVGGDSRPGDAPGAPRGDVAVRVFEHGEKWDDLRAEVYFAGPGVVRELECLLGEEYELTCVQDRKSTRLNSSHVKI